MLGEVVEREALVFGVVEDGQAVRADLLGEREVQFVGQ